MYDAIIIGAGVGGLSCGAKLANQGKKVLIVEKIHHIGGTSHIFQRKKDGKYFFPMGPLSFSHPNKVKRMLKEMGVKQEIRFNRNHFQLITPEIDIIYSQPWDKFQKELQNRFPEDASGIEKFFGELNKVINAISRVEEWHPEFTLARNEVSDLDPVPKGYEREYQIIDQYSNISSKDVLDEYISNKTLKQLLGSQGTYDPIMSMVHLAFMWNVMSIEGIWYPSIGIYGINERLQESIHNNGGEILLNSPVKEILIENQKAVGVELNDGTVFQSEWVVSNADYKTTFLELLKPENVPQDHLQAVQNSAYTGSEISVYLGAEKERVDLSRIRAEHAFYRHNLNPPSQSDQIEFNKKEIEICLWSEKEPDSAPSGKISLILRSNVDFDHFSDWRTGVKRRKEGYRGYKNELANQLIETVNNIIPGLVEAHTILDIATPLTYLDWGKRYRGSIAGWSRDLEKVGGFKNKILINTPIEQLLVVGIYSYLEPFLGGYPVSMHSGQVAAEHIVS